MLVQRGDVIRMRGSERMVGWHMLAGVGIQLEEREIHDPAEGVILVGLGAGPPHQFGAHRMQRG